MSVETVSDAQAPRGGDRGPYRELLSIAAPTVVTMTSYTLMQFVDKLIVSRIGADPIYVGAQGNGGLAAWIPIAVCMGVVTVVNTYVSQNLGAGRPERGPAYAWNAVWISVAFWAVLLVPYGLALPWIFGLLGQEPERVRLAVSYGQILVFGSVLTMATRAVSQFFYGMHRPRVVMWAGLIANAANLALGYALVFGKFGLPRMGVAGSAVGTVLATALELAIPSAVFLGRSMNAAYGTRAPWRPSLRHARDLIRLGWPAGLMFGNEMICWGFFMIKLVGRFGKEHSTAGWIAHQYMSLSFMPAVGISVACTAAVGRCMGMRRPDLAAQRAWAGIVITLAYMSACALAFVALRGPMVRLFIDGATAPGDVALVVRIGSSALIAAAAFQVFDAVAIAVSGSLRGAGDTVYPGVMTLVLSWAIIVGGGHAMVRWFPGLESIGPWIAAAVYIGALCVALFSRFLSGRWKSIRLVRDGAEPAPPAPEASIVPET